MTNRHNLLKSFTALCTAVVIISSPCVAASAFGPDNSQDRSFLFFGKKKKNKNNNEGPSAPTKTDYENLTDSAVTSTGMFDVIKKGKDYYFQIPDSLIGRDMLVVNKLVRVPLELNQAGVNRGMNTSNQMVRFEIDRETKKVFARQSRVMPDVPAGDAIALSVEQNYILPLIASFKIEAFTPDSSAVIVKVTDLFDGRENAFGDVFADINIGTPAKSDLSKIKSVKAFHNNVYAIAELTTKVTEPGGSVPVTVEVGTSLVLLPEKPMARRYVSPKIGYFTDDALDFSDDQQRVHNKHFIQRWRLEPKPGEEAAYLRGELVEPAKPIVIYLDNSTPRQWRPYITKGIEQWNEAFECAGWKNAIIVKQMPDVPDIDIDDMNYSTLTYAASTKSNAMGPSICDPRSGEILEADIIWWHNVLDILHDWIIVQTGATNPDVRSVQLPEEMIGDAMRFVACHEMGHSLGLRHNMMGSAAIPTDSLRNNEYIKQLGGTSSSIMDYARFNYVAQPGDGVETLSPHIGPYDRLAIEYGYRWYGKPTPEEDFKAVAADVLARAKGKMYQYSEAQDYREALDPRALSEDLGDDPVKSASLGLANLKRIVPNIVAWTTTGDPEQYYDEASTLFGAAISQWQLYIYHVLANIGGMYVDITNVGDGRPTYRHVERDRQKKALQFILDEVFKDPKWLFNADVTRYTYKVSNTPVGRTENSPRFLLKNAQSFVLWDMLNDTRLIRMFENEEDNGSAAFRPQEMMDMIHKAIFGNTEAARNLSLDERSIQKNFVDALTIAACEVKGVKDDVKKAIIDQTYGDGNPARRLFDNLRAERQLPCAHLDHHAVGERTPGRRIINFYGSQASRISDAISLKRSELMRVRRLLQSRIPSAQRETRSHYEDMLMRINTALGFNQ